MKRYLRVCTLLLALALLTACGYQRAGPLPYPEPSASGPEKTIACVPLDRAFEIGMDIRLGEFR